MLSESRDPRSTGPLPTRGKLIQLPRIKPSMPGTVETFAASRAPDGRLAEIRAYLAQLLDTPQFSASSRRGQLLQYLVRQTLAGDGDKITEYAIGLEVFRKPDSFDPRVESVVRTEFSRLRQRLKAWYAEEGRRDLIVIDFPPRSYAAIFEFRDPDAISEQAGAPRLVQETAPSRRSVARWIIAAVLLAAVAMTAGVLLWRRQAQAAAMRQPIQSLVVLPFENYSPNHADEYLADGMTDELTNDLAQWRDLRVVARTSAFAFKGKGEDVRQIGQQLNVDAVLEGSFTKEGDQIRVTAHLDRTSDGYGLWSHSYQSQSKDLLAVQAEAANSITSAIRMVRGGGGSPPVIHPVTLNAEAEDLYLQGIYQLYLETPASTNKAVALFQAAIAKDPSFARAYLGIGNAELNLVSLTAATPQEGNSKFREAAQKAIDLDPNLGSAWGELGLVTYIWDWNWENAEEQFRRALDRGAGAGTRENYGWSLATRGRFAEAHEQLRTAAEEDPLSIAPSFDEFFVYNFERDVAGQKKALAQMHRIQANFPGGHALTVVMSVQQHDCATAGREADWMNSKYPALAATQSILAYASACRNDRAETLQHIRQMEAREAPAYQLAIAWALLHDKDRTMAALQRSADAHEGQILYLKYDPFFDGLRSDPRYIALEKHVGLI